MINQSVIGVIYRSGGSVHTAGPTAGELAGPSQVRQYVTVFKTKAVPLRANKAALGGVGVLQRCAVERPPDAEDTQQPEAFLATICLAAIMAWHPRKPPCSSPS